MADKIFHAAYIIVNWGRLQGVYETTRAILVAGEGCECRETRDDFLEAFNC
jgi:hypothetical protein